jgi:sugar phosphate permease
MMMWLPFFISTEIGLSPFMMGILTSSFDVGGVIGSIISGWISDKVGSRTLVMVPMLMMSVPVFLMFRLGSASSYWIFFVLTPICGFLISGASNIISSAVAADLAQNEEVQNNHEALATVAGIIDGTGGVGAALGQFVVRIM